MMMPAAFNNALLIVPIHNKPGYASVSGARFDHRPMEMTLTEAERLKDQDIRSMFELESPNGIPLRGVSTSRKCKSCGQSCGFRCSACRMNYCSRKCQSKDWFRHVFVCCVKNRPNDVDYLKLLIKQWLAEMNDLVSRAHFLTALFRDDHFCKTFGFNICMREMDVVNLLCLYNNLTCGFSSKTLQPFVEQHTLGGFIEYSIRFQRAQTNSQDCSCFPWFLSLYQSRSFDIPNHDGQYLYQFWAIEKLEKAFSIDHGTVLSGPEHVVWHLYKTLLRDFNNIPNIGDPEWIRFGFCYCTSRAHMELLAKAYIQLSTHASLHQIATAWESDTLHDLMVAKGISISALVSDGIYPRQPSPETMGIYRFMSEVAHGLSGCPSCPCKNARCKFHSKDEPLLCQESEVNYGFHSVNTWERWQLLNFYSDLFANPKFNPQKMQEATRHSDALALDKYIESLVPGFHQIIWNEHMTDGMFPKLTSRLKFKGVQPSCECFIHKIPVSEGAVYNVKIEIDWLRQQYEERNREPVPEL